jgi:hypothetical protein
VLLNVVSVNAAGAGHLLVWGDASAEQRVPALNYAANTIVANGTVVNLTSGILKVIPYAAATRVIIDVEGYFAVPSVPPPGDFSTKFYGTAPCRIFNSMTVEGGGLPNPQPLASGVARTFGVWNTCDIPLDARAVALSIVSVAPTAQGHLVAYPSSVSQATFSSLNFAAGETRANASIVSLGETGSVALKATVGGGGTTHVIVDVTGYYK